MNETNDVNTQDIIDDENDILNTETDLEENIDKETNEPEDLDNNEDTESDLDTNAIDSLSDEEFLEFFSSGKLPEGKQLKKGNKELEDASDNTSSTTSKVGNSSESSSSKSSDDLSDNSEDSKATDTSEADTSKKKQSKQQQEKDTEQQKAGTKGKKSNSPENESIDYKTVYESIFKPFKANGKEITPKSIEDVVSLMQMGANYTKKMQIMAPLRKTAETLNKAEITDQDLNFLIDIHKGDKEAIKKLLEKHKVDPVDLDMDNTNYVPKNHIVSDSDVEYSDTLDDIRNSIPKINKIINEMWDAKSKEVLLNNPDFMRKLHEEIEGGRFDKVQSRLEIEKVFGRYKGKSDLEAYIEIVNSDEFTKEHTPVKKSLTTNTNNHNNKPINRNIPDKSKAAPNKTRVVSSNIASITPKDIFSMSEEEFNKLSIRDLV